MNAMQTTPPKVKFGAKFKDAVTGFIGIATARTEYLHGCPRVTLESLSHDGKTLEVVYVDEPRLEPVPVTGSKL